AGLKKYEVRTTSGYVTTIQYSDADAELRGLLGKDVETAKLEAAQAAAAAKEAEKQKRAAAAAAKKAAEEAAEAAKTEGDKPDPAAAETKAAPAPANKQAPAPADK